MNITLINPRLRAWSPTINVPLGLAYVASALEKEHEVKIVDMNVRKVSDKELERISNMSDVIGLTGMITEYHQILSLVEKIKGFNSKVRVIIGGALATTFPNSLLKNLKVDCVVIGEGECAVQKALNSDSRIVKCEQISDLDTIKFPARHLLDLKRYNMQLHDFKGKATSITTSRGCPYACSFCFKDMWGYKWRARSAWNIVDEMDLVSEKYGISNFIFNDDTFTLDRNRVLKLCDILSRENHSYKWMCNGRVNLVDRELLREMSKAGCVEIAYGIESGNQEMLDLINKKITLEQVRQAVKWTKEAGIRVNGYFMIGLPSETKETIQKTIDFAEELDLDFYGFSLVTPMPNTKLYDYVIEKGFLRQSDAFNLKDWSFDTNVNMTNCTNEELLEFKNQTFKRFTLKKFGKNYYANPKFLFKVLKIAFKIQSFSEFKNLIYRGLILLRGMK